VRRRAGAPAARHLSAAYTVLARRCAVAETATRIGCALRPAHLRFASGASRNFRRPSPEVYRRCCPANYGRNRRPGRFAYAADLFIFPPPVPRRGDFVLVSLCWQPTLDLRRVGVVSDLGSPPVHRISRCRELDTMRLRCVVRDAPLAQLATCGRVEFERTRSPRCPTLARRLLLGCNTQNLVGASVTLTRSRLVMGALSISPETGSRGPRPTGGGRAGHARWSNEVRSRRRCTCAYGCRRLRAPFAGATALAGGTTGPLGTLSGRWGGRAGRERFLPRRPLSATRAFSAPGMGRASCAASARPRQLEYRMPLALVGPRAGPPPPRGRQGGSTCSPTRVNAWRPGTSPPPHPTSLRRT